MFSVAIGDYTLRLSSRTLPDLYAEYCKEALLVDEIDLSSASGSSCFVGVAKGEAMPFLVVAQRYSPDQAGFDPGAMLLPDTDTLFIGAGERLLAYDLQHSSRLWEDHADCGFWGWSDHGEAVVMSAELEIAAWGRKGQKLWARGVEPPWGYSVIGRELLLDVMGDKTQFDLLSGPVEADS